MQSFQHTAVGRCVDNTHSLSLLLLFFIVCVCVRVNLFLKITLAGKLKSRPLHLLFSTPFYLHSA